VGKVEVVTTEPTAASDLEGAAPLLPDVLCALTASGSLSWAGPGIEALTGCPLTELLGGGLGALVDPHEWARAEAAREATPEGAICEVGYRLRRADGSFAWLVERTLAGPAGGAARSFTGLLRDDGARRQSWRAEREQLRRACLASLAGALMHELNNPLTGILNLAQLALRRGHAELESLEGITTSAQRMVELTQALGVYTRNDERHLTPAALVRGALTPLRLSLRDAFVKLEVEVSPDLPPVTVRGQAVCGALTDLAQNAADALEARFPGRAPDKVLRVRGDWDEAGGGDLGALVIELADAGEGMSPETLAQVWDPFFTTRPGRDGLGATRARAAIEEAGGRVELESTPGAGTVARVSLPLG
jgi:signal transduction histidine kinase